MTPERFATKMRALSRDSYDRERMHEAMDALMCKVLRTLGYEEGIKIFEQTDKWYA